MGFKEGQSPPAAECLKPATDNEHDDGDDSDESADDENDEKHGREHEHVQPIETLREHINQLDGNDSLSSEWSTGSCNNILVHITNRSI